MSACMPPVSHTNAHVTIDRGYASLQDSISTSTPEEPCDRAAPPSQGHNNQQQQVCIAESLNSNGTQRSPAKPLIPNTPPLLPSNPLQPFYIDRAQGIRSHIC
eukprot:1144527-Pelagomonas_calceolata.AAC.4